MPSLYTDRFHVEGGELVRQITFGANDGIVSIFALLAGVAGANQSPTTILIALLAATIAGAISMAAGEYISAKGENEFFNHEIMQERREIALVPELEKEELRLIYQDKGFSGAELESIVDTISKDEDQWVKEMVIEELGVAEIEEKIGFKTAGVIFIAFVLGSLFPVLPYVIIVIGGISVADMTIFWIATAVTFLVLFLVGAMKKYVTGVNWLKSGVEMLIVGLIAFGASFFIGNLITI